MSPVNRNSSSNHSEKYLMTKLEVKEGILSDLDKRYEEDFTKVKVKHESLKEILTLKLLRLRNTRQQHLELHKGLHTSTMGSWPTSRLTSDEFTRLSMTWPPARITTPTRRSSSGWRRAQPLSMQMPTHSCAEPCLDAFADSRLPWRLARSAFTSPRRWRTTR